MSEDIITAHITETGQSTYSNQITIGNHRIIADEPVQSFEGGKDLGPAPFDLLVSSLAACTIMTIRWYAQFKNIPLESAEAVVTFHKKQGHFKKEITLYGQHLTEADRKRLLEAASKCPVQKTLTGEITIETFIKEETP